MPSSHLPRTPCDKFVYDFLCEFRGIVGGYGLRHMCWHCLRASCDFFYGASGATRGKTKSVQRLCGNCTEIVQCQCSCCAVSAASARKSDFARCPSGDCAMPHTTWLRAYAKPNRRGRGARESVQKSHSCLRMEASRRPHGKGDTGRIGAS